MKISLIIPFYKKINFLEAIFHSLSRQSYSDFEVIVAEDDDEPATVSFLEVQRTIFPFPIKHVNQHDNGFRKNKIMNKAVAITEGELLVFIDGDCLPHSQFLNEYASNSEPNTILWGRRVMLSEQLSENLLEQSEKNHNLPDFTDLLFSESTKIEEGIYSGVLNRIRNKERNLKGCNWGVYKKDLLSINGFDEDYTKATVGEDDDLEWRFRMKGFQKKSLKNLAIVYHLYHTPNYETSARKHNMKIMEKKKKKEAVYTEKGVDQYLQD